MGSPVIYTTIYTLNEVKSQRYFSLKCKLSSWYILETPLQTADTVLEYQYTIIVPSDEVAAIGQARTFNVWLPSIPTSALCGRHNPRLGETEKRDLERLRVK